MPKIANLRNHQGADTDANTRGFIYKLELGSKYTPHSRAGTWTLKWVTAGFFMGWSRGFSEGVEEFKLCSHSDMGLSRALSSVLILIGASCPWPGLSFDSIVGLSRTLSCKQQRFHTWKGDVTLSLFAEDAVLETGNPRASTKTC